MSAAPHEAPPQSKLAAALEWAKRGFRVFPLAENSKVPAFGGTDWRAIATTDPATITGWWKDDIIGIERDYNIGLAMGGGTIAIDLDCKKGVDGVAEWQKLGGALDDTLTVRTPSGGLHCYYSTDRPFGVSASRLAPGIDTRGERGYVAGAGSVIGGVPYQILHDQPVARLPETIATRLAALPQSTATGSARHDAAQIAPPDAASVVDLLGRLPNREDVDRDRYVNVMLSAVGCIDGLRATDRLGDDDEIAIADAAIAWAARWEGGGRGEEYERAKWDDDWSRRKDPKAGWPSLQLIAAALMPGYQPSLPISAGHFAGIQLEPPPRPVIHTSESRLRFRTVDECCAGERPPYVVKSLIAVGQVGCLFGAPGAGKSVLGPSLSYAVARGARAFGRRTRQGIVVYAAAEDPAGMEARVQALKQRHGPTQNFLLLDGIGDLTQPDKVGALTAAVAERRACLLILDTLAAAFPGIDENSSADMGRVAAALRQLASTGAAVIAIHHDPKSGDATPRGHSTLNGMLDVAAHVTRREDDGVVVAKLTKNRNGPADLPIGFKIAAQHLGVDEDGDRITAPVAVELDAVALRRRTQLAGAPGAALGILFDLAATAESAWIVETDWRKACTESDEVCASDADGTRQRAFRRARDKLKATGAVEIREGMVRPVKPDTPDIPDTVSIHEAFAGVRTEATE